MTGPSRAATTVYLIRHGRTDLNAAGLLRGRIDVPLDEVGRAEAERLGALFAGVELSVVLASPLRRALQTAEPVAAGTGAPLRRAEAFLDRDYGPWNGRSQAEVERAHGSVDAAPGVEARPVFERRVLAGLRVAATEHAGRACAVVAHEAVNRALLALLDGRLGDPALIPSGPAAGTGCGASATAGTSWSSTPSLATATVRADAARRAQGVDSAGATHHGRPGAGAGAGRARDRAAAGRRTGAGGLPR